MKKFVILALALVLTVGVLAGCRRGDGDVSTSPFYTEEMTIPTKPTENTRPTDATEQPGNDTMPRGMLN